MVRTIRVVVERRGDPGEDGTRVGKGESWDGWVRSFFARGRIEMAVFRSACWLGSFPGWGKFEPTLTTCVPFYDSALLAAAVCLPLPLFLPACFLSLALVSPRSLAPIPSSRCRGVNNTTRFLSATFSSISFHYSRVSWFLSPPNYFELTLHF